MIDPMAHWISEQFDIPPDYIKIVGCLVLAYVLSPILPRLPSASLRHVMNISVSMFFLWGVLHLYSGTVQLVATSLVVYLIAYFRIGGKHMPWVAFAFEMAHMLCTYVPRLTQPSRASAQRCPAYDRGDLLYAHGLVHEPNLLCMELLRWTDALREGPGRDATREQDYADAVAARVLRILVRTHFIDPAFISPV